MSSKSWNSLKQHLCSNMGYANTFVHLTCTRGIVPHSARLKLQFFVITPDGMGVVDPYYSQSKRRKSGVARWQHQFGTLISMSLPVRETEPTGRLHGHLRILMQPIRYMHFHRPPSSLKVSLQIVVLRNSKDFLLKALQTSSEAQYLPPVIISCGNKDWKIVSDNILNLGTIYANSRGKNPTHDLCRCRIQWWNLNH